MNINNKNKTEFRSLIKKKIKYIQDKMDFYPQKVFVVTTDQMSDDVKLDEAIDLAYEFYLDGEYFAIRKEIGLSKDRGMKFIEIDYIRAELSDKENNKWSVRSDVIYYSEGGFDEIILAEF